MTRREIGLRLVWCAMTMRALTDWLVVNHDRLETSTLTFMAAYVLELSRHAQIISYMTLPAPVPHELAAARRCIFY